MHVTDWYLIAMMVNITNNVDTTDVGINILMEWNGYGIHQG